MAAKDYPAGLILIVTGSTLRAEQMDRPLAYYLQTQIENLAEGHEERLALVLSDVRYLHDEELQDLPTISIGGPGVNLVAQKWLERLPAVMAVDKKFFVQMDMDHTPPQASIWGMNNPQTKVSVITFAEKYLPNFTFECWVRQAEDQP